MLHHSKPWLLSLDLVEQAVRAAKDGHFAASLLNVDFTRYQDLECRPQFLCIITLTPELLLPLHFMEQVVEPGEEVRDLTALVVSLGALQYPVLTVGWQIFTDLRYGEDDLFHTAIRANDLLEKQKVYI